MVPEDCPRTLASSQNPSIPNGSFRLSSALFLVRRRTPNVGLSVARAVLVR
jgi:hypothetical protein